MLRHQPWPRPTKAVPPADDFLIKRRRHSFAGRAAAAAIMIRYCLWFLEDDADDDFS